MLTFKCVRFEALTLWELHAVLRLRAEVFVVEQNCVYQDPDERDLVAHHLLGLDAAGALVAYARLLAPGVSYPDCPAIGRVVTAQRVRATGAGKCLMQTAIALTHALHGDKPIKISAQAYLDGFYRSLQFVPYGKPYLEDGIPHRAMQRNPH